MRDPVERVSTLLEKLCSLLKVLIALNGMTLLAVVTLWLK
jgi:hypothetical protein